VDALFLFHQVSDKGLAQADRAEATLSPQGGGRVKVRPGKPEAARQKDQGGAETGQRRKAARGEAGHQEPGTAEAKSVARRVRGRGSDPKEKEPKGTGTEG
jgi:hypothetical protein